MGVSPPPFADGRGGLVSTAGDLLRFAGMLLDGGGGLLTPASVIAMTNDRLTSEQRAGPSAATFLDSGGWGYGVGVVEIPQVTVTAGPVDSGLCGTPGRIMISRQS